MSDDQIIASRYRVISTLGKGGMGAVYRAEHLTLGTQIALKVINLDLRDDPNFLARFEAEAKNTAKLRHPNNVKVTDFGHTEDGRAFIAMELVSGVPLGELGFPIDVGRAAHVAAQIAGALAEAHALGLVHRDLKPDNILVTEIDGADFARVLDYGIAKPMVGTTSVTKTGGYIGTPTYSSPEQAMSQKIDGRSDIYALGVILYEMVTGQLPFSADNPIHMLYQHVNAVPQPPGEIVEIPARLNRLILQCLEKEPGNRPSTMSALREELLSIEKSVAGDPNSAHSASPRKTITIPDRTTTLSAGVENVTMTLKKRRGVYAGVALAVVAAAVATVFVLAKNTPAEAGRSPDPAAAQTGGPSTAPSAAAPGTGGPSAPTSASAPVSPGAVANPAAAVASPAAAAAGQQAAAAANNPAAAAPNSPAAAGIPAGPGMPAAFGGATPSLAIPAELFPPGTVPPEVAPTVNALMALPGQIGEAASAAAPSPARVRRTETSAAEPEKEQTEEPAQPAAASSANVAPRRITAPAAPTTSAAEPTSQTLRPRRLAQ